MTTRYSLPTESELSLQSEFAVEHLRSDIVSGAWSPGAKLKMRELLPRYDIGASPMREALARLAAEGFVEQRAQRGVRVPELTFEELQDLSATGQIVESEAIRLAALHWNHARRDNVVASFSRF
jgi:GntR family carbon starvation induced transcriptional regulator